MCNSNEDIKEKLTSAPILALPRFENEFILETGVSNQGFGSTLRVVDE